jgi:hypothetical protein
MSLFAIEKMQHEYDINKRAAPSILNNKLGPYEIFGVSSQIEEYVKAETLKTRDLKNVFLTSN